MKKFAKLKFTERMLLLAAVLAFVATGYAIFRYKPRHAESKRALAGAQSIVDRVNRLKRPGATKPDAGQLQRQLDELKDQVAYENRQLLNCRRFLSLDQTEAAQALRVALSESAATTQVRIKESAPYELSPHDRRSSASSRNQESGSAMRTSGPFLDPLVVNEVCGGALHQLVLEAPFTNLCQFIEGLNHLPWRVTVVTFDIEVIPANDSSPDPQPLSSTLLLAM